MGASWTITDGTETHTFERNPSIDGTPTYEKGIGTMSTLAPDGQVVIYQGQRPPKTLTFSGLIDTEAEYDALVAWFDKDRIVRITDDHARTFDVVIAKFAPRRLLDGDWRYSYSVSSIVVATGP
jgi:hypothetical protein